MSGGGRFVDPTDPDWHGALQGLEHDVYHLPEYSSVAAAPEEQAVAFVYREGASRLLLPLLLRPVEGTALRDAASPYGYPGPVSDVASEDRGFHERALRTLVEQCAAAGLVTCFVRLHPLLGAPVDALAGAGTLVHHGDTVSLDLRLDEEEGWRRIRRDHRKDIRRFTDRGSTVVVDSWEHLGAWVDAFHESMRRLRAAPSYLLPLEHFTALRSRLPDQVHLAVALDRDGRFMAGAFFFEHRGLVNHYNVATRTERLAEHPSKAVYDAVRRWGAARGHRVQHLGGGVGAAEDGVFRFKAGFSDRRHRFCTWRAVCLPDVHRRLLEVRCPDVAVADLSGYFPAYRRPRPDPRAPGTSG